MTVGVAERSTVLLVSDENVSMLTRGYALLRVCLVVGGIVRMTLGMGVPGGGIVCMTLGVGVPGGGIVCMTLGVPEGVGCSVCFVHAWREWEKRESRFMYIHCTSVRLSLGTFL